LNKHWFRHRFDEVSRPRLLGLITLGACAILLALSGGAGAGTSRLDQADTAQDSVYFVIPGVITVGETFTAGRTGPLSRVDLPLSVSVGGAGLTVSIETVALGFPTGTVLASALVADSSMSTYTSPPPPNYPFVQVVFSSPPHVIAGTTYVVVLTSSSGEYGASADSGGGLGGAYAGGEIVRFFGGSWHSDVGDLTFRTFVDVLSHEAENARAGYCSVPGNTWGNGTPIAAGTFLNLEFGQPATDAIYKGALAANYIKGKGITCDGPPAGYSLQGTYSGSDGPAGFYPYYAPASS
jgi:hypothetical protein